MNEGIVKLGMPKWGLSMTEGKVLAWLVDEGEDLKPGDAVAEVETEKINGDVEAPAAGVLRRQVAEPGQVIPVGGLLGVIADADVADAEIDAFIAEFQATFVPEAEGEEAGPRPQTLTLADGRNLRYVELGEGEESVVLLHGFGGDLGNWLFNHQALAEGRRVVAVDLPGHGESTKDAGSGRLDELVAVLAEVVDGLGLQRVHLVGHSMGGAVAIGFAGRHPDRVASLVLIASAGLGEDINQDYIEGFVSADRRNDLKPVLQLLFADPSLVTRQLVDDVLRYKRLDGVPEALRQLADNLFPGGKQSEVLRSVLSELDVPVLVIWGREDRVLPVRHSEGLTGRARVEVVEGAGHSPHMERAGDVNRLVTEFWEAL